MAKQKKCSCKSILGWQIKVGAFDQFIWVDCKRCGGHAMDRVEEAGFTIHTVFGIAADALEHAQRVARRFENE